MRAARSRGGGRCAMSDHTPGLALTLARLLWLGRVVGVEGVEFGLWPLATVPGEPPNAWQLIRRGPDGAEQIAVFGGYPGMPVVLEWR